MVPLPVISPHYALRSLSSVASIPHAARLSYHWTACAVNWLNLRRTGGSTCSGQVAQATPDRRLLRTGIFMLSHRISPRTYEEEHNYPVEITMDRWARWEDLNRTDIEGYIRSIGHRILGFSEELLTSQVSLLEGMKSSIAQWLSRILRMIYNSGGELQPLRE